MSKQQYVITGKVTMRDRVTNNIVRMFNEKMIADRKYKIGAALEYGNSVGNKVSEVVTACRKRDAGEYIHDATMLTD